MAASNEIHAPKTSTAKTSRPQLNSILLRAWLYVCVWDPSQISIHLINSLLWFPNNSETSPEGTQTGKNTRPVLWVCLYSMICTTGTFTWYSRAYHDFSCTSHKLLVLRPGPCPTTNPTVPTRQSGWVMLYFHVDKSWKIRKLSFCISFSKKAATGCLSSCWPCTSCNVKVLPFLIFQYKNTACTIQKPYSYCGSGSRLVVLVDWSTGLLV